MMSGKVNREVGRGTKYFAILIPTFGLLLLGLLSLYSSGKALGDLGNFYRQIGYAVFGLAVFAYFSLLDYRLFKTGPLVLGSYVALLLLLAGLLLFVEPIRGARAWYRFGQFTFDPIEPLKLVFIIILANYFSTKHIELYRMTNIGISLVYLFIPAALIFYQPNLGSALVLGLVWLGVLLVSGIKLRHFFLLVVLTLVLGVLGWNFLLQDYQKNRIISFLWPHTSPLEAAWQQTQAKIAIGEGGWWGRGIAGGEQVRYGFLPESQTDFVFAAVAGQWGLVGVGLMLGLFGFLLFQIGRALSSAFDNFSRLYAAGLLFIFLSHIGINAGMNLGLVPIIGISLPFVSYGGSGLLTNLAALGILANIYRMQKSYSQPRT